MLHTRQGGWQLSFVEGAPAALVAMEAEPFDVVVSDFRMPGMDGGRLLAEVRRRYPDTARVILSGHTEGKDLTAVFSLAHQFLTKPCEPEELCAAIDRALRLHQELKGEKVRAEVSGIGVLPSPPSALHDLLAVLDSPDSDDRAVARELEKDVAMATKVLQLVNSSFFAPRARVTSLEAAVAVHADPLPAIAPRPLDLATIVQVAHRVTHGRHTGCGTPDGERANDSWLQRAGLLAEVAGWRAERTEGRRAA